VFVLSLDHFLGIERRRRGERQFGSVAVYRRNPLHQRNRGLDGLGRFWISRGRRPGREDRTPVVRADYVKLRQDGSFSICEAIAV
jgi:hypothetical protein